MIYLFLQALFASLFGLGIKWVQTRDREDIVTVGAINYIAAAASVLPFFLTNHIEHLSAGAVWTGATMGTVYFIAFFFVIYCILWVGVSATTVVSVLSILMPIAVAAIYWGEQPNTIQVLGIGIALLSLTLIGKQSRHETEKKKLPWFAPIVLFVFFLLCGMSRVAQETFKWVSQPEQITTFLLAAFTAASIPSLVLLVYRRKRILPTELLMGVALGSTNILQSNFVLKALESYPGFIVFPVTSAGGILITTLIAVTLLQEKLSRTASAGIVLAVASLFLLHWVPS